MSIAKIAGVSKSVTSRLLDSLGITVDGVYSGGGGGIIPDVPVVSADGDYATIAAAVTGINADVSHTGHIMMQCVGPIDMGSALNNTAGRDIIVFLQPGSTITVNSNDRIMNNEGNIRVIGLGSRELCRIVTASGTISGSSSTTGFIFVESDYIIEFTRITLDTTATTAGTAQYWFTYCILNLTDCYFNVDINLNINFSAPNRDDGGQSWARDCVFDMAGSSTNFVFFSTGNTAIILDNCKFLNYNSAYLGTTAQDAHTGHLTFSNCYFQFVRTVLALRCDYLVNCTVSSDYDYQIDVARLVDTFNRQSNNSGVDTVIEPQKEGCKIRNVIQFELVSNIDRVTVEQCAVVTMPADYTNDGLRLDGVRVVNAFTVSGDDAQFTRNTFALTMTLTGDSPLIFGDNTGTIDSSGATNVVDLSSVGGILTFQTFDGSVTSSAVSTVKFPNGSLTLASAGTVAEINSLPRGRAAFNEPGLADLNVSIVAAWPLNDPASPMFDLISAANLASAGTPDYSVTGPFDSACRVGETKGVLYRNSNALLGLPQGGKQSIHLLLKPSTDTSKTGYICNWYTDTNNRQYLYTTSTQLRIAQIVSSSATAIANLDFSDLLADHGINWFDGAYHSVQAVWDHSDATNIVQTVFVDGVQVINQSTARASLNGGFNSTATVFALGGQDNVSSDGQLCDIAEAVIFNDIITGTQALELWNGGTFVSVAVSPDDAPRFNDADINTYNAYINHVWKLDDSGNTAADAQSFASMVLDDTDVTRQVTGRWLGTTATKFNDGGCNFRRLASFDGPNANTEYAINMDIKFDSVVDSTTAIFYIGDNSTTNYEQLNLRTDSTLNVNRDNVNILSVDITSLIGDGNFHSVAYGRRKDGGQWRYFISIDGVLNQTGLTATVEDLSENDIDISIGKSLSFTSLDGIESTLQNVVMWKGVGLSDAALVALDGAQLQFG